MPIFVVPVREYNDCNLPAGASDGGQFGANSDSRCGTGGQAAVYDRSKVVKAKKGRAVKPRGKKTATPEVPGAVSMPDKPTAVAGDSALLDETWAIVEPTRADIRDQSFGGEQTREVMAMYRNGQVVTPTDEDLNIVQKMRDPDLGVDEDAERGLQQRGVLLGNKDHVLIGPSFMTADLSIHTHPSDSMFSNDDLKALRFSAPDGAVMAVETISGDRIAVQIRDRDQFDAVMSQYIALDDAIVVALTLKTAGLSAEDAMFYNMLGILPNTASPDRLNALSMPVQDALRQRLLLKLHEAGTVRYGQALSPQRQRDIEQLGDEANAKIQDIIDTLIRTASRGGRYRPTLADFYD